MNKLVECVPNFSEGRRPEVIEAIVTAIRTASPVQVLDVSSDADHNRTVVTFVGEPEAVVEAAFVGIKTAAGLIDLARHHGEHPRLGATDVVPFIPLRDVAMADCVALAHRLGERVGAELGIPVYLYEAAATRPERVNLADIRKGEYELLKAEIGVSEHRLPDYGPRVVGPAGATVIGARPFLIAYNLYLDTAEVEVAEKVARSVRHLSGGLRFVKGKGFLVDGRAQVSMNLTDFTKTPIARVQELVKREAERYGARVIRAELVGLIPQQALVDAAQWYLQLDNLRPDMILEHQLSAPPAADTDTIFIDKIAAGTAAPGGGAAGAFAGAMAAGLCGMVARLTIGKKKYAEVEANMLAVLAQADRAQAALTAAVSDDSAAFVAVMAAFKLPQNDEAQTAARAAAIQQAYIHAAEVPLTVAKTARQVLELARTVVALGNLNALSDGASGAHLARACLIAAAHNVRINALEIEDTARTSAWLAEVDQLQAEAEQVVAEVEALVARRRA
jgi:glutamate formiminotransferase/formiminotetrahydrofolate cyclodeaminase